MGVMGWCVGEGECFALAPILLEWGCRQSLSKQLMAAESHPHIHHQDDY